MGFGKRFRGINLFENLSKFYRVCISSVFVFSWNIILITSPMFTGMIGRIASKHMLYKLKNMTAAVLLRDVYV